MSSNPRTARKIKEGRKEGRKKGRKGGRKENLGSSLYGKQSRSG
jgi:hypothetical protein